MIVVSGHRFIGGVIRDKDSQKSYIHGKVDGWVKCVQQLSPAATKAPQAAFVSMTKSFQCEWGFIQRAVPDCSNYFMILQDTIKKCFLPALFDRSLSDAELQLFVLPTPLAGLGVLTLHLCQQRSSKHLNKAQLLLPMPGIHSIAKFTHERQRSI